MGGSSSKSDSESSGSSKTFVWDEQTPFLKNLYQGAQGLFNQNAPAMNQQVGRSALRNNQISNQAMPYWKNQMQGGVYGNLGIGNQLMDSLNQSMNQPSNMSQINAMIMGGDGNNYADAMKDQYVSDANRAQENMLANMDARAAGAGMSGGARHGVAIGRGMEDINRNLQRNMAQTGFQTFDKDLDRKLSIAQQADSNNLSRQQLMSNMLGQQQATQNQGLNTGQNMQQLNMGGFAPYMMPWQAMNQYANVIGRPTILGQGTQSGSSSSKGMGVGF